jgi:hypothetical protein
MDEPVQHLGRAVDAVGDEALGIEIELLHRARDHALRREDLRLTDRRRRLDVDDDRVVALERPPSFMPIARMSTGFSERRSPNKPAPCSYS